MKIKGDVDLAVSFIFNLIIYLFHEDYIQPEATSSSFISFVYFRLREIDVINMVTKPRILQRNDNYFNVTRDTMLLKIKVGENMRGQSRDTFNIGQNTQNEDTQKKTISKNIKDEKSGPRQDREKRTMSNVLCRTRRMMKP